MSGRRRRLRRIEIGLTPTQAAVLWLQEAHRFASMQAYVQWLAGQPEAASPLHRLYDLVVPAVEQALKGTDWAEREQAVRVALREVGFLFFVHQQANARLQNDWRALHFAVALLTHSPAHEAGSASHGRNENSHHERWRGHAENTVLELCTLTEAMRVLGERYFGDHAVLFPKAAEGLAFCRDKAELLVEMQNDHVRSTGRRRSQARVNDQLIDVDAIKASAPEAAAALVAEIVALAKSDVHTLMGDQDAAADAVRPLVVPEGL